MGVREKMVRGGMWVSKMGGSSQDEVNSSEGSEQLQGKRAASEGGEQRRRM